MFGIKARRARRAAARKAFNQARARRKLSQAHYWIDCAARCVEGGQSRLAYLAAARDYIAAARALIAA